MKKYEYVNLRIGKLLSSKSEEHRKIIDEYAAKGYRYVGYIPTNMDVYGKMDNIDLVFERDVYNYFFNLIKKIEPIGVCANRFHF